MEKTDIRAKQMLGFIEILNDLGLNICYIDSTFYVFSEFEPADPTIGVHYITLFGINVSAEVENALSKEGYTLQMKQELFQKISVMKYRRREFHPNITWKKYLADG